MENAIYQFTIPALMRGLGVLASYLAFARERVRTQGLKESDIMNARLAPDMLTFAGQIQRASDKAKNGVGRLAGVETPAFADTEGSLAELEERIAKTIAFLTSVRSAHFEGAEGRTIELRFKSVSGRMTGQTYLTQVLLPDFYFHIATAHDILRNQGLAIGKADFLGKPDYL
ncbi:DUF1993 domain-containing protein [Bradyrhizobium sp. USDA 4454]